MDLKILKNIASVNMLATLIGLWVLKNALAEGGSLRILLASLGLAIFVFMSITCMMFIRRKSLDK